MLVNRVKMTAMEFDKEKLEYASQPDDGSNRLRYIEPDGFDAPLRLTLDEWVLSFEQFDPVVALVYYKRFTMRVFAALIGDASHRHWLEVIEVACPTGTPPQVVFGPYMREPGRSRDEALKYLIDAKAIEIYEPDRQIPRWKGGRSE
jgi:hypothetical protein